MGLVFIVLSLKERDDNSSSDTIDIPDEVSEFFESLVGIFMIGLGVYGIRQAWFKRPTYNVLGDDEDDIMNESLDEEGASVEFRTPSYHDHSGVHSSFRESMNDGDTVGSSQTENEWLTTKTLAITAGIVHGLAGPGGVLGVIPAVQLHNARLASVYLASFCLSSTFTMGCFAVLYGSCSSRLASSRGQHRNREFLIECVSACLSLFVGVLWLFLLSIGKLEDVFP